MSEDNQSSSKKSGKQKIVYYRDIKPPTLKQYLIRRYFGEQASKTKGVEGNSSVGETVMPDSAIALKKKVKGINADMVAKMYPGWVKDYERRYE